MVSMRDVSIVRAVVRRSGVSGRDGRRFADRIFAGQARCTQLIHYRYVNVDTTLIYTTVCIYTAPPVRETCRR